MNVFVVVLPPYRDVSDALKRDLCSSPSSEVDNVGEN